MKKIILFLFSVISALGYADESNRALSQPAEAPVFIIEVEADPCRPSKNINNKELNEAFLKTLKEKGQITNITLEDFIKVSKDKGYSYINLFVAPLYEGPPLSFTKKLPVNRIEFNFIGDKDGINKLNHWSEERFVLITDNEQENTDKIKAAIIEITNKFFAWFKQNYPDEKINILWVQKPKSNP